MLRKRYKQLKIAILQCNRSIGILHSVNRNINIAIVCLSRPELVSSPHIHRASLPWLAAENDLDHHLLLGQKMQRTVLFFTVLAILCFSFTEKCIKIFHNSTATTSCSYVDGIDLRHVVIIIIIFLSDALHTCGGDWIRSYHRQGRLHKNKFTSDILDCTCF